MAYDHFVAVKFEAFSVALSAAVGDLPQQEIDALVAKAEQLLGSDHRLTRAINEFATQWEIADAARRRELGQSLGNMVELMNIPEPPDLDRRDIHG